MKAERGATLKALLGLLSLGPMSGYDIRALIQESIGHFWSESYGQIYPGLKRLATAGLVEKKTERQKGRPDRHLYSLTDEGREELWRWLRLPPVDEVPRNELLLKLFFGAQVPASVCREHVAAHLAKHEALLKRYSVVAKALEREHGHDPDLPYWLITLSLGRHTSSAEAKWCKETLKRLEELERKKKGGR
ncbi:PadR family transcriptional regulator [Edaphobacter bradus]|uniref:PadR family transcriptional regulator n=1 Tax=Edaphobacter bradus TaxID=2259016 RepID=UPI0021E0853C|nr:PadR family transcriptional regulator [Edaphobacter bradus]